MKNQRLHNLIENSNAISLKDNKKIADSFWITFQSKSGAVEGKIHIPHEGEDKLVIFEPGFPGGGSRHVQSGPGPHDPGDRSREDRRIAGD